MEVGSTAAWSTRSVSTCERKAGSREASAMMETDHSPYCEILNLSPPSGAPPGPCTLYLYDVLGGAQVRFPFACTESCAVVSWQPWHWLEVRKAFSPGCRYTSSVSWPGIANTFDIGKLETGGRCLR